MNKKILKREKIKIKDINIELISYEQEQSPYRIFLGKNDEFLIVNNYNFSSLHAKYDK